MDIRLFFIMLNYKLLHKIFGTLLGLEALVMCISLIIALYYDEDDVMPFLWSVVITASAGLIQRVMARNAGNTLSRRDAYFLVTMTWVVFSLFGTMPFLLGGYIDNFTDAYFETMSGFTTTGASIIDDVEALPHGLLFWRTMTQWIGGLGIVFFTIALLPSLVGSGNVKVFSAEATGPILTKLHPRLKNSSHSIWMVYIVLTMICALLFAIEGMSVFDAINYAMTTTATGGFATHNSSTEFFGSAPIEYTATLFMFLSGINFTLLYCTIIKRQVGAFAKNLELRFYVIITLMITIFLMYYLVHYNHYDLEQSFRYGIFQAVSFLTSTGLFSDDASKWHHVTWIVLAISMFIGGCAGSTAGGFKAIRLVLVLKVIRNEFVSILHPNAVVPVKIGHRIIHNATRNRLLAFLALYLIFFLLGASFIAASGVDVINSITISLSCLSNVGPTLGVEIGPTMSWDHLPDLCKWFCVLMMLLGRLEIFSVLILFTREFWKNN